MWFIVTISAFLFLAFAVVIDKFLLTKTPIVPLSYAFYICLGGAILSTPFLIFSSSIGFQQSDLLPIIIGGFSLFMGYYFMFTAIGRSEVSKVSPLITSFIPLSVLCLSLLLNLELISLRKIIGVALVILAGYLLSQVGFKKTRLTPRVWLMILLSSLLLGASNIYSKIVYDHLPFISAFVWLRWSSLIGGLIFVLLTNQWLKLLIKNKRKKVKQPWLPFILGQTAGSLGVILLQYGIKLGNVILVTALNGVQFMFVIIFVYLLTKFKPQLLTEDIKSKFVIQKVGYSLLLVGGVVLIVI